MLAQELARSEKGYLIESFWKFLLYTELEITFFGPEVGPGRFAYMYDEDSTTKIQVMARKTAADHNYGFDRFRINKVFHAYFEIVANDGVKSNQMVMDLPPSGGNA